MASASRELAPRTRTKSARLLAAHLRHKGRAAHAVHLSLGWMRHDKEWRGKVRSLRKVVANNSREEGRVSGEVSVRGAVHPTM